MNGPRLAIDSTTIVVVVVVVISHHLATNIALIVVVVTSHLNVCPGQWFKFTKLNDRPD